MKRGLLRCDNHGKMVGKMKGKGAGKVRVMEVRVQ